MTAHRVVGQAFLVEVELRPEAVTAGANGNHLTPDHSSALDVAEAYSLLDCLIRLEIEVLNMPAAGATQPRHEAGAAVPRPHVAVTTVSRQLFRHDEALLTSSQSGPSQGD